MGKTRDLFKKIRNIKGTFHAKLDTIKDRNGMHLTEAGEIKKRWQEYTEELYKKELNDTDNHDGIITHLESINLASLSLQTVTCRRTGTVSVLFPVVSPSACCVVDILGEDTNQNLGS